MTLSDDEVIERIRDTLSTWAVEQPVPEPPWTTVVDLASSARRRVGWWVAVAAAILLVAAGTIAVSRLDGEPSHVDVGRAPSATAEIPIGHSFGVRGLEVTDEAVWVTSQFDAELYRVDPSTNTVVATFPIPDHVEGVRALGGWLWLSRYDPDEVIRVDPSTGALTTRLRFDSQPNLAVDGDRLWVVADRGGVSTAVRIDPNSAEIVDEIPIGASPGPAIVQDGHLWVADMGSTTVTRVDLATRRVVAVLDVGAEPRSIVAAGGDIWVAANEDAGEPTGWVVRIDPNGDDVTGRVTTGRWIHSLAVGGSTIWATNFRDGTVSVFDTGRGDVVATTPIGNRPGGVEIGHGSVWLTPHRRNVLVRLDPTAPLEPAAVPDTARSVDVGTGTVYVRCSGSGSPTVIVEGNTGSGPAWAVVEARLSRSTRVCVYEPVGIADPAQIGRAGPASKVAEDLAVALDTVGEAGPFIVVGSEWAGGSYAQMFTATHRDDVVGMVLVNPLSADYFERVRSLLPSDALERVERELADQPELMAIDESVAEVGAITSFGDLPLVVLGDASPDPVVAAAGSDPILTVAESAAIGHLIETTRRELAMRSSVGRLTITDGPVTSGAVVDAVDSLTG